MKKILVSLIVCLICVSAYARSQLQYQMDTVATAFAYAANYMHHNMASKTGAELDTGIEAYVSPTASHLITDITVNTTTAAISMTISSLNFANTSIRGLVVTLKPQYELSGTQTDFDLNIGDSKNNHIDRWVCTLNNATAGVDFATSAAWGITMRIMRSSKVATSDKLQNVLAQYCADTAVTTA